MDIFCAFLKEIHVFLTKVQHSNYINNFELDINIKMGSSSMTLQHLLSGIKVESAVLSDWQQHNLHSAALTLKAALQCLLASVHTNEEPYSSLTADNNCTHSYVMNNSQMSEHKSQDHADVKPFCSEPYIDVMQQNQLKPTIKETDAANILMNLSGMATGRTHQEQNHIMHSREPDTTCEYDRYNHPSADSLEHLNDGCQTDTSICNIREDDTNIKIFNEFNNNMYMVNEYSNSASIHSKELSNSIEGSTLNSVDTKVNKGKVNLQKEELLLQQKQDIPVRDMNILLPVTAQAEKSNKLLVQVGDSSENLKDETSDALAMVVLSSDIRVLDNRVTVNICLGCTTGFIGASLIQAHTCTDDHPLTATHDNGSVSLTESHYTFNGEPYFPDFFIRRVLNETNVSVEMIHSSSGRIFRLESDNDVGSLCQNIFVFKCPKCCTDHDSLDQFLQHLVKGPCVFRCTQCTLMYNTPEKVETHHIQAHPSVEDRTCPRCKQVFDKRHQRNKHFKTTCSQYVACQICGAVLKSKYSLWVHMNSHSDPPRFNDKQHLQLDVGQHSENSANKRHSCAYCDRRFSRKYDCDRHSKRCILKPRGINCDTSNSNSRLLATKEVPIFLQNTEQIFNTVRENDQPQILARVANVDIESKKNCNQNTISNKLQVGGEHREERKKSENGDESEKQGKYRTNTILPLLPLLHEYMGKSGPA